MRKKKSIKPEAEDMFLRLTLIQVVTAVLIGGVFFGAYKLNGDYFNELREGFVQLMFADKDIGDYLPYNFMQESTTEPATQKVREEQTDKTEEMSEAESETVSQNGAGGEDDTAKAESEEEDEVAVIAHLPEAVMPVAGTVSSLFGNRIHPVYGTEGFHSGLDIAADEGSEILAVFDGTVTETGVGEKSGNYIKLDNGNGVETLYCHCAKVTAEKGQRVKRGEKIAVVGQTGLATGPHLHLELHINGEKHDPACLFKSSVSVF